MGEGLGWRAGGTGQKSGMLPGPQHSRGIQYPSSTVLYYFPLILLFIQYSKV